MPKYQFKADVVIEASDPEDALSKVSTHVARVARHMSNASLEQAGAAFTLSDANEDAEAVDVMHDPLRPPPPPDKPAGEAEVATEVSVEATKQPQ